MMSNADAIWLSAITAFSAVATATVNMIGSVLILYIRAKYGFKDAIQGNGITNGIRDIRDTGAKP